MPSRAALAALDDRSPFADAAARLHGRRRRAGRRRRRGAPPGRDSSRATRERQAEVGARRQLLQELRRKYGETLAEVIEWREAAEQRLAELEGRDVAAAALDAERAAGPGRRRRPRGRGRRGPRRRRRPVGRRRSRPSCPTWPCPRPGSGSTSTVPAGHDVVFRFAANPGMPLQPLAKVASGGELARAMLALRLVLTEGPPVLVFDEVDAGIGGAAALAVGRSLAAIADDHQVLVVTHLAQVAAWADAHVVVDKQVDGRHHGHDGRARSTATRARPSWPACSRAPRTRPPPATTPASSSRPPHPTDPVLPPFWLTSARAR